MIPEKVTFSDTIEIIMSDGRKRWKKLEISGSLSEGETFKQAAIDAEAKVQDALKTIVPSIAVPVDYSAIQGHPQEIKVDREIGVTPEIILSSPDLTTLLTYKFIVKGKPDLQKAYDERMKQVNKLSKKNGKPVLP
jgi:hypothetical protein